ncbi:sulfide dehydrogenase [flavocytochrome c] flavoprotein chain precursor [bacterium BMS3Bbin02]|nr:sulfide dehydrogenase [flavocytochrome c] flavoprotein chain precursor [bacterium BMS3Bbin02]
MKHLIILGAGTAGTMAANKLRPLLQRSEWDITIVDQTTEHHYQPGYLFIPFGMYTADDVVKESRSLLADGINFVNSEIERVDPDQQVVHLANGDDPKYDYLLIATGTHPRPDQTPGLDGPEYGRSIHDFYTLEGATRLHKALESFTGGRLAVNVVEMPIKCPVAPLEFTFLADSYFKKRGIRDKVDMVYVTPLPGAFTKPVAAKSLGGMLDERDIGIEPDFMLERVDTDEQVLVSYDERKVPYDLLVTVPINMGADFVARSGLGDELNHVPVDKHTFLSKKYDTIFALGDAAALPTSKAGSVAHFAVDVFTENFVNYVHGRPMERSFDGHANCFIESGDGKAMLIDFNYVTQPLEGMYPLPGIGPFPLLHESRRNHWAKLAFRWTYWHMLLPGHHLPVPNAMSMAGKHEEDS